MKRTRRAFTWVEVLVAIFLIGTAASVFVALIPMASKTQYLAGNYEQASSLVQHKVDQLRTVGYGRLTYSELSNADIIDASPTGSPYSFAGVDGLASIYGNATGTITISDFSTTVKQVVITLTWTGSALRQGNGTLAVTTLISKG